MSKKETYDDNNEMTENLQDATPQTEERKEANHDIAIDDESDDTQKSRKRRIMDAFLSGEGEANITNVKDLVKNINLNGEWFRRNISFIITITVCLLVFVTNRYQAQQEQIEEAKLKNELAEMRYKWLTRFSELTTSTRQSHIEEQLRQHGDTTLTHSKEAPFIIKAKR